MMNIILPLLTFLSMLPYALHSGVYFEKPNDFNPKVEVVGCFLEYQGQILLLHRQNHKYQGNQWAIPGGKIDASETPIQGAIRETCEETSFDLSNLHITYLGKVFIKAESNDPKAHKCDYIYHMIKASPTEHPGSVKIHFDEHKGFTWVTPKDALKMDLMLDEDTCIKMIYQIE